MFGWIWALSARRRAVYRQGQTAYGAAVEFARQPILYTDCGVPDTVDGRFDMIALAVSLRMLAWQGHKSANAALLGQALFDVMFTDMDRSLREMGVGDLGVPKRIKKMMLAFNGRLHRYAVAVNDATQWPEALQQNVYRGSSVSPAALSQLCSIVTAHYAELLLTDQPPQIAADKAA